MSVSPSQLKLNQLAALLVTICISIVVLGNQAVAQQSPWPGFEHLQTTNPSPQSYPVQPQLSQAVGPQIYGSHVQPQQHPTQTIVASGYHSGQAEHTLQCATCQHSGKGCTDRSCGCQSGLVPWEDYGVGEYIGPHRTPHINDYRLRVNDQIEFVFQANRAQSVNQYRLSIGDTIRVVSATDERLNAVSQENGISIMSDGTISLDIIGTVFAANRTINELQAELNVKYAKHLEANPRITVSGINTDTRLRDFLSSVDARAGSGGQARTARVTADGTLRLPLVGAVRVIGLTLDELEREINGRFNVQVPGVHVSVVLAEQAPSFIYVMGEVNEPGRFELNGPTSVMQAVALASGWQNGGNLRQIVVLRRDQNWRLMALRLNLRRGLNGQDSDPLDEIWLRDSDVLLIPKRPIVHVADAVELYFTRTLYALFPSELGVFDAQSVNAN